MMIEEGGVHACTDITGFGFLGHALEMIEGSDVGININSAAVPVFKGVRELMETGFVPGGLYLNKNFRIAQIEKADTCPSWLLDVFFDPQTSRGLFFSLPRKKAQYLVEQMHLSGIAAAAVVGDVVADHPGKIFIY